MNLEHLTINQGDIVKIVASVPEQGRYAKVLRVGKRNDGETQYTLKVNNYWNSSKMRKQFGEWDGLMWCALILNEHEVILKKQEPVPLSMIRKAS
ncbi:hypothetical protein P4K96_30670 [Bacillus cereus]|nr:hypothetical protein [Bacillus cereus]